MDADSDFQERLCLMDSKELAEVWHRTEAQYQHLYRQAAALQELYSRMDNIELVETLECNTVRMQRLLAGVTGIRAQLESIRFEFSRRAREEVS